MFKYCPRCGGTDTGEEQLDTGEVFNVCYECNFDEREY